MLGNSGVRNRRSPPFDFGTCVTRCLAKWVVLTSGLCSWTSLGTRLHSSFLWTLHESTVTLVPGKARISRCSIREVRGISLTWSLETLACVCSVFSLPRLTYPIAVSMLLAATWHLRSIATGQEWCLTLSWVTVCYELLIRHTCARLALTCLVVLVSIPLTRCPRVPGLIRRNWNGFRGASTWCFIAFRVILVSLTEPLLTL